MDIFAKCYEPSLAGELKEKGVYPYFHALQSRQDVEVMMEGKRRIMLGSNNYLGLTTDPEVVEAGIRALEQYGTGCSGSRFLNGTLQMHLELEEELGRFLRKPGIVTFGTGFQSNVGIISALVGRHDYVICDRENHASIYAGCQLSYGKMLRYRHSDMAELEKCLQKVPETAGALIVTDGVFSMGGDIANLHNRKLRDCRVHLNDPAPRARKKDGVELVGKLTPRGKEHIAKTIKEYYDKNYEYTDIRNGIVAAIAINVEEPVFESQTKIKLGSTLMEPGGETINKYIGDFIKREVDNYLHIHKEDVADILENKIKESERERKAMAGVTKLARERAKKANLHNRKLRDCRIHFCDAKDPRKEESSIFITEGDSASGSITKSRDVNTQAVFSLRGKPLNSFGLTKKVVYENEEFNLLQAALDIEDGLDGLRYNKVIVATDADVDGMHIRLLIITFFLQFFPDLIKKGHVYVLQTPLFRVRNKRTKIKNKQAVADADAKLGPKEKKGDFITHYCYSDEERQQAIRDLGPDPEITRFKGLGEISPEEFAHFIGPDMRLEQVTLHKTDQVQKLLEYYMGKNTMERQNFIIDNLVIEEDIPEEDSAPLD